MTKYYIENEYLKVGVKDFGSELTSVILKENGKEYLWQGDEKYWTGQSPILFPIVGRLIDDKYTLDGVEYGLPQHGFARRMPWRYEGSTENSITFSLSHTEETLKVYPYKFEVRVIFTVEGRTLKVTHIVENINDREMYASIGAHPAFNCAIGDRLVFSEKETLSTEKIDLERSIRLPETYPVLDNETTIVITEDIFNGDALVFKNFRSQYITLESDSHSAKVIFDLGGAPYLGIWAKPGAPYVCIEPWCGVCDSTEKKADFSQKDSINRIESGDSFTYIWKAEFTA